MCGCDVVDFSFFLFFNFWRRENFDDFFLSAGIDESRLEIFFSTWYDVFYYSLVIRSFLFGQRLLIPRRRFLFSRMGSGGFFLITGDSVPKVRWNFVCVARSSYLSYLEILCLTLVGD